MGIPVVEASATTSPVVLSLSPRTQKARGIAALAKSANKSLVPRFEVYSADTVRPEQLVGYFSRPCPMRPRHGFVDSRKIHNAEEGRELIQQTLDADPEAEIVTMPLVDALYSGIWTPGLLTVGQGHDGATAGHFSWSLPSLGTLLQKQTIQDANVQETPYVELLWPRGNDQYHLVQLRDGPSLPLTVNFIPETMKIERIVEARGDLLDWEREMQAATPGTIVYHPRGSLASHYAIHAVLNHIPVLIDRKPAIGEVIEPEGAAVVGVPDLAMLRAGFQLALRLKVSYEDAAHAMLAGCHHLSVWTGRHDDLLGLALGFAYRLTVAAALGEMRHIPRESRMRRSNVCRTEVYDGCWNKVYRPETQQAFEDALRAFHQVVWVRGYGGAKWFFFARWAALLRNSLAEGNPVLTLQALNQLVHCAHNTGWGFNKFVPEQTMTDSARAPISALVLCVPVLHRAHRLLEEHCVFLARHFVRNSGLLLIPDGEPNYEDIDPDEERCRSSWDAEEVTDEPMAGRRTGRGRSGIRGPETRRVSLSDDIPF